MLKKLLSIQLIICLFLLPSCAEKFDKKSTVHRFSYAEASGLYTSFLSAGDFISLNENGEQVVSFGNASSTASQNDMKNAVTSDISAVGYISSSQLTDEVKALKINGFAPSYENIKSDKYELYHPLNLAYDEGKISDGGLDFVRYIFSKDGQHIISKNGYITFSDGTFYISSMPKGVLTLYCSYSSYPVVDRLARAYMNLVNKNLQIEIQTSHTEDCITSAGQNGGIAFVSSEVSQANLTSKLYSADGIAIIVNPLNPIDNITSEQLKKLFSQNELTWEEF